MEHVPLESELDLRQGVPVTAHIGAAGWRAGLPVLEGPGVMLRELRLQDAPSLLAMLATEEVARFMSPPPTDVQGFERFVVWTCEERAAGRLACFGIVPDGEDEAVGLFQVRQVEGGFDTAEWGVAIGSPFWGSGVYVESATLVAGFAFETLHTYRLEARAAVINGRANGALQKIGAVREGVLRRSLHTNGQHVDQILWSILREDWFRSRRGPRVRVH